MYQRAEGSAVYAAKMFSFSIISHYFKVTSCSIAHTYYLYYIFSEQKEHTAFIKITGRHFGLPCNTLSFTTSRAVGVPTYMNR